MDTDTTSRLCWLSSMAPPSTWTFLSPKAWGLETLGTETRSSSHLKVSPAPFTRLPMCSARLVLSLCDRSDAPGLQGVGQRDCTSVSGRPGLPVSLSKSEKPHRCCCLRDCWGPLGCTGSFWWHQPWMDRSRIPLLSRMHRDQKTDECMELVVV